MWTAPWDQTIPSIQWGAVIGASLVAAVIDVRSRRIPNMLTVPLLLAGLAWASWTGGWPAMSSSLAGVLLLALPYIVLFLIANGGAADAKLMAAIGAWLGFSNGVIALFCVAISGAVLGICYAVIKRQSSAVGQNTLLILAGGLALLSGRVRLREASQVMPAPIRMLAMPYGLAIFMGVCIAAVVCAFPGAWTWTH